MARYNQAIKEQTNGEESTETCAEIILQCAKQHLKIIHPDIKQEYITAETWELIEERQIARNNNDWNKERELNKSIKKHAKEDKIKWRKDRLEEFTNIKTAWSVCN